MHSAVFSAVLYSRRRRRDRCVQQYRPRISVSDATRSAGLSLPRRPERGRNGTEFCLPELNIHAGQ